MQIPVRLYLFVVCAQLYNSIKCYVISLVRTGFVVWFPQLQSAVHATEHRPWPLSHWLITHIYIYIHIINYNYIYDVYGHVLITLEHSSSRCYLLVYLSLSYHYSCLLLGRTTMPGPWINPYLSAGCRFVFYLGPTIWQPLAVITCSSVKCQAFRLLSEPQMFGHFFLVCNETMFS